MSLFDLNSFGNALESFGNALVVIFNGLFEYFERYPTYVLIAGERWGEYGWVPFLPDDNAIKMIDIANVPTSQNDADSIMLNRLNIDTLFSGIEELIYKLNGNRNAFQDSIKCYNNDLYFACSLSIFSLIDQICIVNQKKIQNKRRKLALNAINDKYNNNTDARYFINTIAVKKIVNNIFCNGNDFDPETEGCGNRNFISHGMNNLNPDKTFCIKLFVLLYNICLLYSAHIF